MEEGLKEEKITKSRSKLRQCLSFLLVLTLAKLNNTVSHVQPAASLVSGICPARVLTLGMWLCLR